METAPVVKRDPTGTVVVGVDGSACSYEALEFGVGEARLRGAKLRIVTAWSVPGVAYSGGYAAAFDPALFEESARSISAKALERARGIAGELEIDAVTPHDTSAQAIMAASEGADMLVVGSRGHGGFASLLLGSVSQQLAHHAPCPVVIIHEA